MKTLSLNSYAKLNLFLLVINKREDNYHNLSTLFERISLCDRIILKLRSDNKINIITNSPALPKGSANLCYQSAKLLQDTFNIGKGLDIRIIKRIPVGAGLGGGSSNAASVLIGLNKLWGLKLSRKKLAEIARKIGCDVPFFIYDVSFALASGRGDEIRPLTQLRARKFWQVVVVPKIHVSTPFIYKKWDKHSGLTMPKFDVKLLTPLGFLTKALREKDLSPASEFLFNNLEPVTVKYYPKLRVVKERLIRSGLKTALMSGSGPAVFGIAAGKKEAVTIANRVKAQGKSLRVFAVRTM